MDLRGLAVGLCVLALAEGSARAMPTDQDEPTATGAPRAELPIAGVVTNPDWEHKPTGDDLANYYPPLATFLNMGGHATISCTVTSSGDLSGCLVAAETPASFGFGEAALKMAPLFKMKPQTLNGAPVGGATVNVPINFAMEKESEAVLPQDTGPEPSPAALALGRRLATAVVGGKQGEETIKSFIKKMNDGLDEQGATPAEHMAVDDMEQAYLATLPDQVEHYARYYAQSFSEQELTQITAFSESPAGQDWFSHTMQTNTANQAYRDGVYRKANDAARERFCSQVACQKPGGGASVPTSQSKPAG